MRLRAVDDGPADSFETWISKGNALCMAESHEGRRRIPLGARVWVHEAGMGETICRDCMHKWGYSDDEIDPTWEPDPDECGLE